MNAEYGEVQAVVEHGEAHQDEQNLVAAVLQQGDLLNLKLAYSSHDTRNVRNVFTSLFKSLPKVCMQKRVGSAMTNALKRFACLRLKLYGSVCLCWLQLKIRVKIYSDTYLHKE